MRNFRRLLIASLVFPALAFADNAPPSFQKSKILDSGGTNVATVSAGGALKTDGSAATQPVSAASLPLPSGASTAAKQPALGTAGSASADVITVQGVASMTALKTDGSGVTQPISGSVKLLDTGGSNIGSIDSSGRLAATVVDTTATGSLTGSAQAATIALNNSGTVGIQITGSWAATLQFEATIDGTNWFSVPTQGNTFTGVTTSTTANTTRSAGVAGFAQFRVRCSAYTSGTAVVNLRSSGAPVLFNVNASAIPVDASAGGTVQTNVSQINGVTPLMGNGTTGTGSQRVTVASDNTAFTVNTQPISAGFWTYLLANALTNTATTVKASAGALGGYFCYNPAAAVTYLQIYDTSSVTVGTTTPKLSFGIPAAGAGNLNIGEGVAFGTVIKVAATTAATNGTAPGTALDCSFWFK